MSSPFAITVANTTVQLPESRQGEVIFTVSNTSGQQLEGRANISTTAPASVEWFQLAGDIKRSFASDETHQSQVQIAVPPDAQPGSYSLYLEMIGVENPDEQYSRGPTVQVEVPAAAKEPAGTPFPWWIVAVVVGVLLVGGGLVAYLIWGRGDTNGPVAEATATPTPTSEPTPMPTRTVGITIVPITPPVIANPTLSIYSSGMLEIPQTWSADLDEGLVGEGTRDIWFEAETATSRFITPRAENIGSCHIKTPGYVVIMV
jgi:hypothetical protein